MKARLPLGKDIKSSRKSPLFQVKRSRGGIIMGQRFSTLLPTWGEQKPLVKSLPRPLGSRSRQKGVPPRGSGGPCRMEPVDALHPVPATPSLQPPNTLCSLSTRYLILTMWNVKTVLRVRGTQSDYDSHLILLPHFHSLLFSMFGISASSY